MVVLSIPAVNEQFSIVKNCKTNSFLPCIPLIDLSKPDSKNLLVKACEEFGFFKVVNHCVPMEFIIKLESEAIKFFSSPLSQKEKTGPPDPFGYGNKKIGLNGDVGWLEYILLSTNSEFNYQKFASIMGVDSENIRAAVNDYVSAVKKMACDVLEMLADGLKIHPRNVFSKLLMDEQSDSVFRVNHYPPCPEVQEFNGKNLIGNILIHKLFLFLDPTTLLAFKFHFKMAIGFLYRLIKILSSSMLVTHCRYRAEKRVHVWFIEWNISIFPDILLLSLTAKKYGEELAC